ncbi:MAG TPA: SEC-C metal-binding domain-containing protein, partial [Myxococcaceae bacterium]
MSSSKPGRNDPCPCGSGKKYKACHAAEDRARAAPPPAPVHPLAAELQAAMALLGDPDVSKLSRALDQLGTTLASWGPAPGLRFEASAFDTHITQALEALPDTVEQAPAQARRELFVSTVNALGTGEFLEALRAALLQRAAESGRLPEERQALCVGALLASVPRKSQRFKPEDIPVLEVVFDVQFREWCSQHRELADKFEGRARA